MNGFDTHWGLRPVVTVVADLGNSRLKWGRLDARGWLADVVALSPAAPADWAAAWSAWQLAGGETQWWISSVNPPLADALGRFLDERAAGPVRWFRSAADVPVRHELDAPETAGADRALAVLGALAQSESDEPGLVISCGTAVTVERISSTGTWQGGAIAAGLGLTARALHMLTAQLPLVDPGLSPPAWGRSTRPALEAGIYWGVVGAVRELIVRQVRDMDALPWHLWTGGDASRLAPAVDGDRARIAPDLVLQGLACVRRLSRRSGER